jgi:hypothetical protein
MFDFLLRSGRPWFNPQNEVGNRGLIRQIRAIGMTSGQKEFRERPADPPPRGRSAAMPIVEVSSANGGFDSSFSRKSAKMAIDADPEQA